MNKDGKTKVDANRKKKKKKNRKYYTNQKITAKSLLLR